MESLIDQQEQPPAEHVESSSTRNPQPTLRHLVGRIDRSLRTRLDARLVKLGLTSPSYTMMFVLRRVPGLSNADLARRAGLTPQSSILTLRFLLDRGLVERQPSAKHGRTFETYLTPSGTELITRCEAEAASIEDTMLAGFTRAERAQFDLLLRRCAENLNLDL